MTEFETTLARSIRITEERAQYDAACKRLLAEKIILAIIMKAYLPEFRDYDIHDIAEHYIEGQPQVSEVAVEPDETGTVIQGLSTEDTSLTEGKIYYDIRFTAIVPGSGERIRLIINVEAQSDFYPGYPLIMRAIYYCCRLISRQNGTEFVNSHYEKIKKVYSIWICMDPPKEKQNTILRYRMTEECLAGNTSEPVQHYDLLSIIMVCLGKADSETEDPVLQLLNVLFSEEVKAETKKQVLSRDFGIPMTQKLNEEVTKMSHPIDRIASRSFQKGINQGIQQGINQGIQQGINQGIHQGFQQGSDQALLSSIRNLTAALQLTEDQAMSILKVPEEKRADYRERLKLQ